MRYVTSLLLAAACTAAFAQEIKLPAEIRGEVGLPVMVVPEIISGGKPKWRVDPTIQELRMDLFLPPEMASQLKGRLFYGKAGRYKIEVWNAKGDVPSDIVTCWIIIGDPPPIVVVPPVNPPVDPVPSPISGMRVLILHETALPLPKAINDAIFSPVLDEYFRLKCLKGPDGKTAEVRREDDDSLWTNMPKVWQDLRAKLPAQLPLGPNEVPVPHVAIGDSSGNVVFAGPFPANDVAALEFFKKYGGP